MHNLLKAPKLRVVLAALGILYPFLVYFGLGHFPPSALVLALLAVFALKLVLDRHSGPRHEPMTLLLCLLGGAVLLVLMIAVSPLVALKSYPVLVSLGFAAVFSASLLWPPTIVERIARLRDPDLPASAIPYLRRVTLAWLVFFFVNAAISTATALSGSVALWTLYNGFISYVIMGALFAGELIVRFYLNPG